MKKTLDRSWLYAGRVYGPGEVELPDKVATALERRGAFESQNQVPDSAGDSSSSVDAETENQTSDTADGWSSLTEEQIDALIRAGYDSTESVRAASDEQLLAINGIGKATVRRIRELL